ncbi:MAG: AAA family ATPase [Deltaproteobacteria bacterium]|nr:AAA family ATPase [Deltaproteobacteria bacterium]
MNENAELQVNAAIARNGRLSGRAVDRDHAATAADILEQLLPDADARAAVARVLAELVRHAHARGDRTWAVSLFADLVRLNVGRVHAAVVLEGVLFLELDPRLVDESTRDELGPRLHRATEFKATGPALEVYVPAEEVTTWWPRLRESSLAFVDKAAAMNTSFSRAHSPGVLAHLGLVLGQDLPTPAPRSPADDETPDSASTPDQAESLEELELFLAESGRSHREFFVPIVRAIADLGGSARKREVVGRVRELLSSQLSPKQLDYLENNNRFGWARFGLKKHGAVTGEYGRWELTSLGWEYAKAHSGDPLTITLDIREAKRPSRSNAVTESVEVSSFRTYQTPALKAMAEGVTAKHEILEHIEREIGEHLLAGDRRRMPSGQEVWRFRAAWALSNLGKDGLARNTGSAEWSITDTGRERLETEGPKWRASAFRGSKAKVLVEGGGQPSPVAAPQGAPSRGWSELQSQISRSLYDQIDARLRPDLGPSPDIPLARNVILYGPPGTGKTYLAKQIARALTNEDEVSEEGRIRLVQFHPSYAYEDFVQGLRPDLKHTQLRYERHEGPFLRVAAAAEQEPDAFFVLVIDEINRGDPARIFGELLYSLEYREEAVTLPQGGELRVPANLIVVGTMNSVDRSVALVDYALRRRFGFVRVEPDPEVIASVRGPGLLADIGPSVLERFNDWIRERLGRDYVLGHSFFIAPTIPDGAEDAFARLWATDVRPLLEEYFYGDEAGLADAMRRWQTIVSEEKAASKDVEQEDDETPEAPPE